MNTFHELTKNVTRFGVFGKIHQFKIKGFYFIYIHWWWTWLSSKRL